ANVPHGFSLTESTSALRREAYGQLMQGINDQAYGAETGGLKDSLLFLYQELGAFNTEKMLDAFLEKRAEWWAATQFATDTDHPLIWLEDLMGTDGHTDARLSLWSDESLLERISNIALCLGKGTATNQTRAVNIETALSNGASLENFNALAFEFYGADGTNRKNRKTNALLKAIELWLGSDNEYAFDDECDALAEKLKHIERRSGDAHVLAINRALFCVGEVYLECYQSLKAEQRVFDFADLEWQAYRLLSNEELAAYLHGRLDSRYKHILLDEFQDTNPLQWHIVAAWLAAYGADADRPSVFIVGDPKQSIYRFRRAEPRVFAAAQSLLARQGALVLRTNQTRRNASAIIQVLNEAMLENKIFTPQTTASDLPGAVWRLPLIRNEEMNAEQAVSPFPLRDPLTMALPEQDDARRYDEGVQVTAVLHRLRKKFVSEQLRWSDVMLLVRRRSHLVAYEKALRDAKIPFVSSRRGGLLLTLEVADFIALLGFLITPSDDKALAHVLKSPLFGASDQDLIALALRTERTWWQRLCLCAAELGNIENPLGQAAHDLPVHDLLDRILHQGDMLTRYARAASSGEREQTLGNIKAFTELALNMDGGRYPSLPKFIAALKEFAQGTQSDTPDESVVASSLDAVRMLTIHSAKGLEAKVVVILDSNHSEAAKDQVGILCAWPLSKVEVEYESGHPSEQEIEQKHFSVFGKKSQRGAARDALFAQEEALAAQENWNLLYVAATRAKQILVVSGIASEKSSAMEGVNEGSWYQKFSAIEETLTPQVPVTETIPLAQHFVLSSFRPPNLALPPPALTELESAEQIEGIALHALMEKLTNNTVGVWPIQVPTAERIAAWLPCALSVASIVREQAVSILGQAQLARFFHAEKFVFARNEMDIVFQQQVLRIDRLVAFEDEVWILDYKRQLLISQRDEYQAQLAMYKSAVAAVYPQKKIKTALILTDGNMVSFSE
ncbi:MAG: UvrD-helicase domain-containing protein, partial [Undibacterium sp.]|nr:UvrD-helicase domain-containing protein [Undibacterium sp.]